MPNTREKRSYLIDPREKLALLIVSDLPEKDQKSNATAAEKLTDHLIANGVTVQADKNSYAKGYVFAAKACTAINAFIDSKLFDGKDYADAELYYQDFAKELEKLYANYDKADKWIPVTERLPEIQQRILVWCESKTISKHVTACTYMGGNLGHKRFSRHVRNVTHWMPLPAPPEGE